MARSVYATIQDLRDAGLGDTTLYPDVRLWGLLELSAEIVEALTQQFFGPRYLTVLANGWGRLGVHEEHHNKIIELESVSDVWPGGRSFVGADCYVVHPRCVRRRQLDTSPHPVDRAFRARPMQRWRHDDQNVELVGAFGWMDLGDKFETVLAADLARGATVVKLESTGDIEPHDVLLVDRKFWVISGAVVPAVLVPTTPGEVTIDPSPRGALAGAEVIRYGKIPRLVREAAIRTAIAQSPLPGSEEETDQQKSQRLKREKTDNYEIEFFAGPAGAVSSGAQSGTGDPIADGYLSRFRAGTVCGRWV